MTLTHRCAGLAVVAIVAAASLAGCTATPDPTSSSVVSRLGAVPIPTAPATDPMTTATFAKPQLLAMGAPTIVQLDATDSGIATATGPDQTTTEPSGAPDQRSTQATITLTVAAKTGSVTLSVADLICRDETGAAITLAALGPSTVTVPAGSTGKIVVSGHFDSGAAQITWQPTGRTLALWDFNIELD